MADLRIAVVGRSPGRIGGIETYLADIIPALASRHDVGCWFEAAASAGQPLVCEPRPGGAFVAPPGSPDALLRSLAAWRPDVVYLHGLQSVTLECRIAATAPVVFFVHSYYGACISGEKATRLPVHVPCDRVFGAACLARYFPRRCGGFNPLTMVRQYDLQRRRRDLLAAGFDAVLVASRHMARHYASAGIATRVVPLPVQTLPARPPSARRVRTLLYLGRIERSKGVHEAIQASAYAAGRLGEPLRVVIAGHGSSLQTIREDAAALTASNAHLTIEWPGWLSGDARAAAVADADLLLVPSVWPEPFGLAGVEAASAGLPAVAFRVGGIEDWLTDGVNGRLVPLDGDRVQAMGETIARVLRDPDALREMSRHAVAAAQRFTMANHLRHLEPVLAEAVERRQKGRTR